MARVTRREVYATESNSEILSKAKLSAQEATSNTETNSEAQEIAVIKNDSKAAIDFANSKKLDGKMEATLLKNQLLDTASRLDGFREGDLKGLEKDAKKFGIQDLGVIKDNLGKDIARHEGPGIDDMYKKSKKYEMPDRDPLNGLPKTEKQQKDAKKAPDMPFKDDPSWAMDDNLKGLLPNVFGNGNAGGKTPLESQLEKKADLGVPNAKEVDKAFEKAGVYNAMNKANKYVDPDQVDATKVEKPKDPPPNSKDLLGHKVNPLNNDPIIDTENIDIKKVVAEHKGPKKTLIYTDPEQTQKDAKFDPSNPPRIIENELKNTGNPNDFNGVQFELPKGGGDQPHTDGEGGDQPKTLKAANGVNTNAGGAKETKVLSGTFPTPTPGEGDDTEQGPNVPR